MKALIVKIPGGFSLTELVIAVGISSVLAAAVFSFLLYSSRSYRAGQTSLRLQREAARAVQEIAESVRPATSIAPAGETTNEIFVTTPESTYYFGAGGGVLLEAVGGAPPQPFFDDPAIVVANLSFTKIMDASSGSTIPSGLTIDLTLTHPAVSDPVSSSASAVLRNTSATFTPPPADTPTPVSTSPSPTLPLPTFPIPTPTFGLPTPNAPATPEPQPNPTSVSTPICIFGVCL